MLSLMRRPRLDAAAAMAATRFGSCPFENECAIGNPSLDANKTPFNSGIALRRASMWAFNASPFAIKLLLLHFSPMRVHKRSWNRFSARAKKLIAYVDMRKHKGNRLLGK